MNGKKKERSAGIMVGILFLSVLFLVAGHQVASLHHRNLIVSDYEDELNNQVFAKVVRINSVAPNPDDSTTNIVKSVSYTHLTLPTIYSV